MIKCNKCGTKNFVDSDICVHCGSDLEGEVAFLERPREDNFEKLSGLVKMLIVSLFVFVLSFIGFLVYSLVFNL